MRTKGKPWSFRAKFLLSTVIATLVVPTICAIVFFKNELSLAKESIFNDTVGLTENIAKNLYPTLAFDDLETAKDELQKLIDNPQITSASLWKTAGGNSLSECTLFCSTMDARQELNKPTAIGEYWSESTLQIVRPIQSGNQPIGAIMVERSLDHLQYKEDQFIRLGLTSWTSMIIVILFVTVWYQNTLTMPLQELTRVAEKISSEKNYNLRAKKMSMDEFGKLTDIFNEMLDSINETNQQLHIAHQNMEQIVENRTRQLTLTNQELLAEIKEREKATQELIETRDRLSKQEKLASVGQVSSNIAHELRNPMAAIRNSTYLLRLKNNGDHKTSHHLEVIDRELSRSDDVIQRLLKITKGETLRKEPTDLLELAREAMTYSNITGSVSLSLSFSPKYFPISLDRILFRQIFCNLFCNAIQAMPDGGKINLLTSKLENGQVLISISDQGIGIKQKDIKKVFDPLFTDKEDGVGLGLSLCRELVTRHGGTIEAKSEKNQGTTIEIVLPAEDSKAETRVKISKELTSV
jgi:signal transduction histidine kinase